MEKLVNSCIEAAHKCVKSCGDVEKFPVTSLHDDKKGSLKEFLKSIKIHISSFMLGEGSHSKICIMN